MKVLHNGIYHLVNVHDHLSPPINPLEHPHPLEQSSIGCGEILNPHKVTRLEAYQNSLEPADQGTVYMQDLESALYYMIKKEASAKTEYTEDEDETIRSLIKILGSLMT